MNPRLFLLAVLLGACPFRAAAADAPVTPLTNVHAHNDYAHTRPLLDALDQGFCSVEADIYLVDGKLLVAHDRWQVKPERTLQALYLDPIRERVRANQGRVYPNGPEFFLLIDFKSNGESTLSVLRDVLKDYASMLSVFRADGRTTNAVTAILTGESPRAAVAAEPTRLAAIDGRLPDLETNPSPFLVPWISENWSSHFYWRGRDEMPAAEKEKLRQIVAKAHQQGRKVRFWGSPDTEALWSAQRSAGVDLINTDRLAELRRFLTSAPAAAVAPPAR